MVRGVPASDADAALVAAARRDPVRFVDLYDRYFEAVHLYVRRRVRDRETAEDVTSQVFMTALAKIGDFRGDGPFRAWLFSIAFRAVLDTTRPAVGPADDALLEALADETPGPEEQVLRGERLARLRELLAGLRGEQRRALVLRFGGELSAGEIASLLGTRPGTVRVRLHRTLRQLRGGLTHDA